MSYIIEKIMGKKEKIEKLTPIMLDSHQCRCVGCEECNVQFKMFKHDWCGISPKINVNCAHRRMPEVSP